MNLPNIWVVPVISQNFSTGVFAYSRPEQTITLSKPVLLINFAAILKVNQAGSLYDALQFAEEANQNNIRLITSHRSGESTDNHIAHIGIATRSKMLKVGVVGGERIAKLNELLRLSEHDLIRGMNEI